VRKEREIQNGRTEMCQARGGPPQMKRRCMLGHSVRGACRQPKRLRDSPGYSLLSSTWFLSRRLESLWFLPGRGVPNPG